MPHLQATEKRKLAKSDGDLLADGRAGRGAIRARRVPYQAGSKELFSLSVSAQIPNQATSRADSVARISLGSPYCRGAQIAPLLKLRALPRRCPPRRRAWLRLGGACLRRGVDIAIIPTLAWGSAAGAERSGNAFGECGGWGFWLADWDWKLLEVGANRRQNQGCGQIDCKRRFLLIAGTAEIRPLQAAM